MTRPTTIGSTPDFRNATHAATPMTRYAAPARTPRALITSTTPRNPIPASSGATLRRPL
jgi:hypothetical protein